GFRTTSSSWNRCRIPRRASCSKPSFAPNMAAGSRWPAEPRAVPTSAPCLSHIGREAFPGLPDLSSELIVQFADLLRFGDKVHISLPCILGLKLDDLVE